MTTGEKSRIGSFSAWLLRPFDSFVGRMQDNATTEKKAEGKARALAKRKAALSKIEQAQTLLYEAAQLTCPLHGFADQWTEIGDHADATKALWHRINNAAFPTGHD